MNPFKAAWLILLLGSSLQALPLEGFEINLGGGNAWSQGYLLQTGGGLTWHTVPHQYFAVRSDVRLGTSFTDTPNPWQTDLCALYGWGQHSPSGYLREWAGVSAALGQREGLLLIEGPSDEYLFGSYTDHYYRNITYLDPGIVAELEAGIPMGPMEPVGLFLQYNWTQDMPLWTVGIKIRFY